LRGPDFTPQKAPGTYRIICLGNSCTFGWRVREQEVYPRQTQAILEQRLPQESWEVINAGVTGYTSLQGLRFLRREVLRWQPDLLIINYCWNDHWAAAQDIADKDQRLPSQWILDLQNTFNCTYTYRWLKYLVFSLKKPPAADFSRDNPVYRVSAEDFRENLRRMITLATERKIPVLLLTAPIAERADPRFSGVRLYHDKYNGVIRSFSDTAGVFVLDAAAEFSRYTDLFDHPERDLKHYNANGHSIIARMIAEYISRLRNRNY
jgi:lysophospholipase L1-like esterase